MFPVAYFLLLFVLVDVIDLNNSWHFLIILISDSIGSILVIDYFPRNVITALSLFLFGLLFCLYGFLLLFWQLIEFALFFGIHWRLLLLLEVGPVYLYKELV